MFIWLFCLKLDTYIIPKTCIILLDTDIIPETPMEFELGKASHRNYVPLVTMKKAMFCEYMIKIWQYI